MSNHYEVTAGWLVLKTFFGFIGDDKITSKQGSTERYNGLLIGNALSLLTALAVGALADMTVRWLDGLTTLHNFEVGHMTLYDFLKDQGGLIGGVIGGFLTLIAGLLAYQAGRQQARAVEHQNADFRRSEKRRLARESLVSQRILDGILAGIIADLEVEINFIGNGIQGQNVDAAVLKASRKKIRKPDLAIAVQYLGACDVEWINNYMALDRDIAKIHELEQTNNPPVNAILDEFRKLHHIAKNLRELLAQRARSSEGVLAETQ